MTEQLLGVHVNAKGSFWPPSLLDDDKEACEQITQLCGGDEKKGRAYTHSSSGTIVEVLRWHWNDVVGIEMRSAVSREFAAYLDERTRRTPSDVLADPHAAVTDSLRSTLIGCAYEILLRRVGKLHLPRDADEALSRVNGVLGPLVLSQCRTELGDARKRVAEAAGITPPSPETPSLTHSALMLARMATLMSSGKWPVGVFPGDARLISHDPRMLGFLVPAAVDAGALAAPTSEPAHPFEHALVACILAPNGPLFDVLSTHAFISHGVTGPTILDHIYMTPDDQPQPPPPAPATEGHGKRAHPVEAAASPKRARKRTAAPAPNRQALAALRSAMGAEPHAVVASDATVLTVMQSQLFDDMVRGAWLEHTGAEDPLTGAHVVGLERTPSIDQMKDSIVADQQAMKDVHALFAEKGRAPAAAGERLQQMIDPLAEHPWSVSCMLHSCMKGKGPTPARVARLCAHIVAERS